MENVRASIQAAFLDVRDTLGEVDQPGNFLPYRPSTEQLLNALRLLGLRIGAITSIPDDWEHADGIKVIRDAVLSQDAKTGKSVTIGDFIAAEDIVSNKEAGAAKPDPRIYDYAARKFGLEPNVCLFVGENLVEVIGAQNAGMQVQRKQCPPGRDFAPALVGKVGASAVDSGRQFQALLEHEHLLGERIFACGDRISAWIAQLIRGWSPKLDEPHWESPPAITVPETLKRAMACFIFLLDHFADQVHLLAEEKMLEVAVACGMPPEDGQWVLDQHDQARAYWAALDIAWRRIKQGDADDRWFALNDFQKTTEAFNFLFKAHAIREDYQTYTEAGTSKFFSDSDDSLIMNLIVNTGPSDITPYVGMVERMEGLLANVPDANR